MRKYTTIILLLWFIYLPAVTIYPKHEVRAAWLTTIYGLDWPSIHAGGLRAQKRQQIELCRLLDELKAANFNTILFQTRLRGDVIYPSKIEPFNETITGKSALTPTYDPLAFAIEECHKRGMEIHAWMVTIPIGTQKHVQSLGSSSLPRRNPLLCKLYQQEWYLNPGQPEVKTYLASLVNEVVSRYDVDGIHFDYIRYPDHPENFPDEATYRSYSRGESLSTWRRNNITVIVRTLYNEVKALKPWVKVSSSPLGKFSDTFRYSSHGWNAYYTVYQNAQAWLREGIQDMLFPMMYFSGNNFFPFALDWKEKSYGRYVVPGLGIYFLDPKEKDWSLDEIQRQIYFTRSTQLAGQAYYRAGFIQANIKRLTDELTTNFYAYPALLPAFTWLDKVPPTSPTSPIKIDRGESIFLSWKPSTDNDLRIAPYYTVYASDSYPVDTDRAENIVETRISNNNYTYTCRYQWEQKTYFAITASDRYGNESKALQIEN
ncbi:MAG: family 10 glycosylhydrolase [Bacteroidaceae bacterium]